MGIDLFLEILEHFLNLPKLVNELIHVLLFESKKLFELMLFYQELLLFSLEQAVCLIYLLGLFPVLFFLDINLFSSLVY